MDATRLQFPSMLTISPLSAIPFTDVIYMDAAFASRRTSLLVFLPVSYDAKTLDYVYLDFQKVPSFLMS